MIFNGNTTALGASAIPMAEGYDCSYGASLALVEAARNDYSMFRAMVEADYKEMSICRESADAVVMEGEMNALQEAVGGGIFKKIADLFRKLVGKVKGIFHTFMSKVNGIAMKDKDLVKKYQKEVLTKKNIGKLEVKWRKAKGSHQSVTFGEIDTADFKKAEGWAEDAWDRTKVYLNSSVNADSMEEYRKEYVSTVLEDEDTVKLGDIGGIRAVLSFISDYASKLKTMQSNINKSTTKIEKLVKEYEKAEGTAAKAVVDAKGDDIKGAEDKLGTARKEYDMAQAYQTAMLAHMQLCTEIATIEYKQNKAALMKAIAVNDKKLEESAVYAQAVAEAAEQEVEDVIGSALNSEEISKLSGASKDVKDGDVSDCPNCNTYGPNCYTANASYDPEGSIDADINSREESAMFGKMFY